MPDPCPRCGAPRSDTAAGLCPRCLMGNALGTDADVSYSFATEEPGRVLETLALTMGAMPRVLLPDTVGGADDSRLVRPSSGEMPPAADRSGRVQLLGEIARGGMGAVLKGRDPDLGRDLAVKVLLEAHRDKPELVRRFVEEAQIGGQLQHPGIVPVYELGAFGDSRPYFTMKLVKGRTLAELLAERPRPSEDRPRFVAMLLQVAQTVAYAHSRGVIHRDLKPSNIMVGSFGEVQVMDWGLAKVLPRGGAREDAPAGLTRPKDETLIATSHPEIDPEGDFSKAGSILGTPSYMAPEQARGEVDRLDERSDVFALGSILAEVLTGQPAFTGRNGGEILRKSARGDLAEAFRRLDGTGADAALIGLARDCLAAEPEDRPGGAQAVADALLEHVNSVHLRLREAELAQAAEHARAEEAKRTALAESARAEAARHATEAAEARAVAERRARRLQVGLAASLAGLMALGGGGYAMVERQRADRAARTARAVDEALADAARLRGEAQAAPTGRAAAWALAASAANRAEGLLSQGEADSTTRDRVAALRARIDREGAAAAEEARRLEAGRALLADLELARGGRAEHGDLKRADAEYAAAFRKAGLDLDATDPAEAGRRLAAWPGPAELAGHVDDWADLRRRAKRPEADWLRLVAVARAADPDPWRDALRARAGIKGPEAFEEFRRLADDAGALDAQPSTSLILLARKLKFQAEDLGPAARVLRRAIARDPADFWARIELGNLHGDTGMAADKLFPRPEESVRHLTAAVAIRPGSFLAHTILGNALQALGRPEEALAEQREAIRLKLDSDQAHGNLGLNLAAQGKWDEAVAAQREAIRINPGHHFHHNNLGIALMGQGEYDEAVAELREAIRIQERFPAAYGNLNFALRKQGKFDEAAATAREAIRLLPENPEPHEQLGTALHDQKRFAEAVAEYREAIRLKSDSPYVHRNLGEALKLIGKLDEAVAELREAVRLRPDEAEFHERLGAALNLQGKLDESVAELREAARLKPDEARFHSILGIGLRIQGKLDGAAAELREAVRLKPGDAEFHDNLGLVLAMQEKIDEAIIHLREAIRLNPDSAQALHNLGVGLMKRGQYAEALVMARRGHEQGRKRGWDETSSAALVAEAEKLAGLASRLPAILKGEDRPKDAEEALILARVCHNTKRYAGAARLWSEALGADPKLGQLRGPQHRYNAACSAALAADGQGQDEPTPDDSEKARLRGQALDRLRLELSAWAKLVEGGDPKAKAGIVGIIRHWKADPDLVSLRDPEALGRLPEGERNAWRGLWGDADALLTKAQGVGP